MSKKDWDDLNESKSFIVETYNTVPMYRPLPLKLFGVLNNNDHPTPESKYWQCKIEAEVHAEQIINDIHSIELLNLNIEKSQFNLEIMLEEYNNQNDNIKKKQIEFDIREQRIHLSKLNFRLIKLKKELKYRIEEVNQWRKISNSIKETTNIDTNSYIRQYLITMKHKLNQKIDISNDSTEKENLKTNINELDKLLNSVNQKQ